jgi:purine-binding chemotaxis protein CheW
LLKEEAPMSMTATQAGATAVAGPAADERRQLLRFTLAGAYYGVPIEAVREILQVGAMTAVPMMPRFVRGVMNLRGAVVPVFDLCARLGLGDTRIGRRTCVVIIDAPSAEGGVQRHGVLVDAVHEVLDLAGSDLSAVPALGTRVAPQLICGVARVQGQTLELLDVPRIFDEAELARLVGEHCAQTPWLH